MLKINQLNGFDVRSEAFSVQVGETKLLPDSYESFTTGIYEDLYLGPSVRNRWFVICMNYRSNLTPTEVRLGGFLATLGVSAAQTANDPDTRSRIYYVRLDSGIVADLVVNWSLTADAAITIFRVTSPVNLNFDNGSGSTSTGTVNVNLDAAANGAIFAASASNQDNPTSNWTGVNEVFQGTAGTSGQHAVAYQDGLSAQVNRLVSITGGSSPSRSMCALSISPGS